MYKKVHLSIAALFCATVAFSQSGAIKVHMFDATTATKDPIPFANVVVEQKGQQIGGGVTDINGDALIKPLDPGEYDVKAVSEGFQDYQISGVTVGPSQTVYRDIPMQKTSQNLKTVIVVKDKVPLVNPKTITGQTITHEDIMRQPTQNLNSIASQTAGIYQSDVGGALNVRGARSDATQYIVDGMKLSAEQSPNGIPQMMIGEITTITGGTPANYGDNTGGIVEINTVGASPKWFGSVQGITSEVLDGFGYNDVNFVVGGPLWSKKDTATGSKKPILDFILGGEYTYEKDNKPTFVGGYTVNQGPLDSIAKNPFQINPLGGYLRSAEFITANDISHTSYMPNSSSHALSANGKLGLAIGNNIRLVIGGSFEDDLEHTFTSVYELFNSVNNPIKTTLAYRAFVRYTQKFPTPADKEKTALIKNAFYTVQAEFGHTSVVTESEQFKDNFFDYGYQGQFYQYRTSASNPSNYVLENGSKGQAFYFQGFGDSLYTFKPGTLNPLAANYTTQLYSLLGQSNITNYFPIEENSGLLNGDRPHNVYSLWYNTGRTYGGYDKSYDNHLRFSANFSADIKDHALQIGFEYEQSLHSYWNINAVGLWTQMRYNLVNTQIAQLDLTNPILVSYGTFNAYFYNQAYNPAVQSQFDKSMRQKLGLAINGQDYLQPDNYDPSFFSLDMFSAADLINNNNPAYVVYSGYNYLGTGFNNNASIDDFFNAVDANGNRTYPVAPYHPVYMAAYIQDHFDYKSMKFDVGLRFDRFDNNSPVLKDPYLLYPTKTVSEVEALNYKVPSNMGASYAVYVNNSASSNPTIVGYRNGNTWYDANGNELVDPSVLTASTVNGGIQPFLENPNQTSVNSDAFTTYTPQINVMPRVAFSFPISDVANFFAHYDILTQRPPGTGYNIFNPMDYAFPFNRQDGSNPALKPQQTTDYELGFTQVLNEAKSTALTLSAFYREMRNQVQEYQFLDAYPTTYIAFSNLDFGTVKGLSVAFDLRRVNNVKFRASYTLQFANGTGSGPTTGANLAAAGLGNLQVPQPLSFDQRHTFLLSLDYHYASGDAYNGPVIGKSQVLADAGVDFNFTAGSGTPFTRQSDVTQGNAADQNVAIGISQKYTLVGSINGSYLPWSYRLDMRIDKDFPLTLMKSKGDKALKCDIMVYLTATNLLNTQNVLNVYHYTGSPTDDGFLTSLNGQAAIAAATSPQAFQDQYKIKVQDPTYLAMPREMRLGVIFNF